MVGPVVVPALTTPAPPPAEEGSYHQGVAPPWFFERATTVCSVIGKSMWTACFENGGATPQYSVRG